MNKLKGMAIGKKIKMCRS